MSNRRNDGVWCQGKEEPPPIPKDKYAAKTEVYCSISYLGIAGPVFVDNPRRVNSTIYTKEILPVIAGSINSRSAVTTDPRTTRMFISSDKWVFQQDLAPSHTAAVTSVWLKDNDINHLPKVDTPPKLVE